MVVVVTKKFYPKTRSQWRRWLQKYHATKKEIWLVRYKKVTGKQTVNYQDSVDEALCFGWIDGMEKGIDTERYATRFTPRRSKSAWTTTNMARYKMLLRKKLMMPAGRAAFRQKAKVYIWKSGTQ